MNNLEIREFEQAIINFANQSALPIEVKRLCFADILRQVETESERALGEEIVKRQAAECEKQEEEEAKKMKAKEKGGKDE